jgi:hypothetical protein
MFLSLAENDIVRRFFATQEPVTRDLDNDYAKCRTSITVKQHFNIGLWIGLIGSPLHGMSTAAHFSLHKSITRHRESE